MSGQQTFMPDDPARNGKRPRSVPKPFEVWYRFKDRNTVFGRDWHRFGRYRDDATAQQVLRQKSADPHFEYEVRK